MSAVCLYWLSFFCTMPIHYVVLRYSMIHIGTLPCGKPCGVNYVSMYGNYGICSFAISPVHLFDLWYVWYHITFKLSVVHTAKVVTYWGIESISFPLYSPPQYDQMTSIDASRVWKRSLILILLQFNTWTMELSGRCMLYYVWLWLGDSDVDFVILILKLSFAYYSCFHYGMRQYYYMT